MRSRIVDTDRASPPPRLPWFEFGAEALGLGLFMVSACLVTTLLEHPGSSVRQAIRDPFVRRALIGLAMGLTAVGLIYSPWGKRSGAHLNPSVTLTFWSLGRVSPRDAAGYVAAQFLGGTLGVAVCAILLGPLLATPEVNYAVTKPGMAGVVPAFLTEWGMSFGLMAVVLAANASPRALRYTGLLAGAMVAGYIALLAPFSGMSMNPARTFASGSVADMWSAWWIYFLAPPLGMFLAAGLHRFGTSGRGCAKLHHAAGVPCIFCSYRARRAASK